MRVFFCLTLDETAIMAELTAVQTQLQKQFRRSRISWSDLKTAHMTLIFLGELPLEEVVVLREAVRQLPKPDVFELKLRSLCCFPNPKNPQVLAVETNIHPSLLVLRRSLANVAANRGLNFDNKPFHPHLTLGRVKIVSEVCSPEKIKIKYLSFTVRFFDLMESRLGSDGQRFYQVIERYEI